jgi:hypothetical protein
MLAEALLAGADEFGDNIIHHINIILQIRHAAKTS